MKELKESTLNYRMVRDNSGLFMEADEKFKFENAIYDEKNENWIFAVTAKTVEYIYLTKDFEIIKAFSEDMGVIPHFIKGMDGTIWTTLSSTFTEKYGEIVLPLNNREQLQKVIIKKDIGMDYFIFNNRSYGYFEDIFEADKESKIAIYEFDKKAQYKNRKMIKLDNIYNGFPIVAKENVYFAVRGYGDNNCKIYLYRMNESFETEKICESTIGDSYIGTLVGISDNYFTMMNVENAVVKKYDIDYSGKNIEVKDVFQLKSEGINHSIHIGTSEYCAGVIRTETVHYAFLYKNGTFIFSEVSEEDKHIESLDDNYYVSSPLNGGKRLNIRKFV